MGVFVPRCSQKHGKGWKIEGFSFFKRLFGRQITLRALMIRTIKPESYNGKTVINIIL